MQPAAKVRYGRPKGSGLDDRAQLAAVAEMVASNPKLKATTAIRSLGIEDPSVIRRLRDKFRADESRLVAEARRAQLARPRLPAPLRLCTPLNENAPTAAVGPVTASPLAAERVAAAPAAQAAKTAAPRSAASSFSWFELGLGVLDAAIANQAALAQCFMHLPTVAMAMRAQLAMNSVAVAVVAKSQRQAFASARSFARH